MKNSKVLSLVQLAMFGAIIFILAFTPFVGYIPLGPIKATIVHVPVIIGSIILGPKKGAFLGFLFGVTSFISNTFISPTITSFVFTPFYSLSDANGNILSLVICFVPRILVGVVPYFVCKLLSKLNEHLRYIIAGICGSLTNTLLVMNMIYLFFGESYGAAKEVAVNALYSVILSVICVNGIPEAIVAAIITAVVVKAIKTFRKGNI